MIHLNINNNSDNIYCTPMELAFPYQNYDSVPNYWIKFISRQTNSTITILVGNLSTTDRYQKFNVNTSVAFANKKEGFWDYYIKPIYQEFEIGNNIDIYNFPEPVTNICERGLMYLVSNNIFEPTKYEEQNNQFKTYSK